MNKYVLMYVIRDLRFDTQIASNNYGTLARCVIYISARLQIEEFRNSASILNESQNLVKTRQEK